jgi:hypothetical protein
MGAQSRDVSGIARHIVIAVVRSGVLLMAGLMFLFLVWLQGRTSTAPNQEPTIVQQAACGALWVSRPARLSSR